MPQKEERVLAHIFVCFLAYVLWKTLGHLPELRRDRYTYVTYRLPLTKRPVPVHSISDGLSHSPFRMTPISSRL